MLKEERRTYRIGETADELGVTATWLRFGERLGSMPRARRTAGGIAITPSKTSSD